MSESNIHVLSVPTEGIWRGAGRIGEWEAASDLFCGGRRSVKGEGVHVEQELMIPEKAATSCIGKGSGIFFPAEAWKMDKTP